MSHCPSLDGPLSIECPACRGFGCRECGHAGELEVTACVRDGVPRWAWTALTFAVDAEEGRGLPVAGGLLDQTAGFLAVWRYVSGELRAAKADDEARRIERLNRRG